MDSNYLNEYYSGFIRSITQHQWKRIGLSRRAGVAVPLFSVFSKKSAGIGELPDLCYLIDWCVETGMSVVQLLPMNDVGFDFRPYDAQSTFAIEPMFLRLSSLKGISFRKWSKKISALRRKYPMQGRVNYAVKSDKLGLLREMFNSVEKSLPEDFYRYCREQSFWLDDYSLFKGIKDELGQKGWEGWPDELKYRNADALQAFKNRFSKNIQFHQWLQWQLFLQFTEVKKYALTKNVFLMGDLPFLVSRDSADVWSHQNYFKLHLSSGAPPDAYFALGQRWGMPPYEWPAIADRQYDYLIHKLRYAENFFDMFRIDHVVGIFRLWSIALTEPLETAGLNGRFDPEPIDQWEEHGRRLLSVMIQNTAMLPVAEDLGVVPECSYKVLEEFGIPGMDVQRWAKHKDQEFAFISPEKYRKNSISVISSHDMSSFRGWWLHEANTVDEILFVRQCKERGIDFEKIKEALFDLPQSKYSRLRWRDDVVSPQILCERLGRPAEQIPEIVDGYLFSYHEKQKFWQYSEAEGEYSSEISTDIVARAIEKAHQTASIFSIHLMTDWLSLNASFDEDPWQFRINFPGDSSDINWSILMPVRLDQLPSMPINSLIKEMNQNAHRI